MNPLVKAALLYKSFGFSIIPVNLNKKSLINWRRYQYEFIDDEFLVKLFSRSDADGIAVICGEISGNLEVLDVDSKYDLSSHLFDDFYTAINKLNGHFASSLCIGATRNNGYHFYYQCTEVENYQVLARRATTNAEKSICYYDKLRVLIETRARGQYAIVPPTIGYHFIQHDLEHLPVLEPAQRLKLLDIARSFNLYERSKSMIVRPSIHYHDINSPLNDYDARGDVIGLLQYHGWKLVRYDGIRTYFQRPGLTDHETSGDFHHGYNLFGVFTTSTDFIPGEVYRPSAVYAFLECNKDFSLAAKRLLLEGYGIPYKKRLFF